MSRLIQDAADYFTSAHVLDPGNTTGSIAIWGFPEAWPSGTNHQDLIIDTDGSTGAKDEQLLLIFNFGGSVVRFGTTLGDGSALWGGTNIFSSPGLDVWYHFAITWDGTGANSTVKVYLNGVEDATDSTKNPIPNDGTWVWGAPRAALRSDGGVDNFRGPLAEGAAWNVVLKPEELASLAAGTNPLHVQPAALQVYIPFNGSVDTADEADLSGNGINLTAVGSPNIRDHPPVTPFISNPIKFQNIFIPPVDLAVGGGGLYDLFGKYHPIT